jgi:hypothetical protein
MKKRDKFPTQKNESSLSEIIGVSAAVAGLALLSVVGYANSGGRESTDATESITATDTNPYADSEVLVYAPLPLTAEEAIAYFVARDQLRLPEAAQAVLADQLTADFESQTGLEADKIFNGNANGTQYIRIGE